MRLVSGGVTRILGSVNGGRERTFQVENPSLTGRHNLTATGFASTGPVASQPFSLFANSTVTWTIVGNQLLVGERLGTVPDQNP